jgi:hypothetical protein
MKKTIKLTESELIGLIKKVINEQRFNLTKSVPKGSRFGMPETDAGGGDDFMCKQYNIISAIKKCKKGDYIPDDNSRKLGLELYNTMSGINFNHNKTYEVFKKIKDSNEFCKIVKNFNYEKQPLDKWISGEWLDKDNLWDNVLKNKLTTFIDRDFCSPDNLT